MELSHSQPLRSKCRPVTALLFAAALGSGCIGAPLATGEPDHSGLLAQVELSSAQSQDLLIVVDDSISMADKQRLLARALTVAAQQIVCRSLDGRVLDVSNSGETPPEALCTFRNGDRVGIITSSLESGGTQTSCSRGGRLVPLPDGQAFFDARSRLLSADAGAHSLDEVIEPWLESVGEAGCGYEAPLEAMYRFLIDPEPPKRVRILEDESGPRTVAEGVDEELLAQRRAFLRDDSQLTVLVLSDEDDCSVLDSENGFRIADQDGDPNVRCFDQEHRFGESFLFLVERYVRGLTSLTVVDRSGQEVPNPLFAGGRTPDLVQLAGLVGVPWQLVATPESLDSSDTLELYHPDDLAPIWPTLLGSGGQPAKSAYMIESLNPRPGLAEPASPRGTDPILSHEYDNPEQAALQHACLFPLLEPVDCTKNSSCDCAPMDWRDGSVSPLSPNNPVCQAPDGSYGAVQYFGRAYPAPRLLSVLQATGGVVGSICPRSLDEDLLFRGAYGYNSIFRSLTAEWQTYDDGLCLSHRWPRDEKARTQCKLIEVLPKGKTCDFRGRRDAPPGYASWTLHVGEREENFTFCEVAAAAGDASDPNSEAYSCAHDVIPTAQTFGYCLIEPAEGRGNPELVKMCAEKARRRVRLVPNDLGRRRGLGFPQRLQLVCPK